MSVLWSAIWLSHLAFTFVVCGLIQSKFCLLLSNSLIFKQRVSYDVNNMKMQTVNYKMPLGMSLLVWGEWTIIITYLKEVYFSLCMKIS